MPRPPWHPDRFRARLPYLERRARLVRAVRGFFDERDFLEVETPALQVSPGLEPHLMSFATELEAADGRVQRRMHLHTSPEFAMKKLLVAGAPRIYQLARVFRNREGSRLHSPEFTLLEWYRAGASYRDLMEDCRGLLQAALRATGNPVLRMGDAVADPFACWTMVGVAEAFDTWAGIDLLATMPDPAAPSAPLLAAAAAASGVRVDAGDDWETLFFRVFLERIEPNLGQGAPTILYDYPISMAALSRPRADDSRLAERFELYVCGVELANAFGELTDAARQRARFVADMDRKEALYGVRYPIDEDFLAALAHGMPESAGIALGIDRLAMLATGAERIEDVLWLPVDGGPERR
ncbi:MAG: EF-P lysine aminoacylase GenX [Alphaproteobacteria bacterium]|nr:EF-P lysine aminoacylase GenX [Alphaproteobacteria bacterium]